MIYSLKDLARITGSYYVWRRYLCDYPSEFQVVRNRPVLVSTNMTKGQIIVLYKNYKTQNIMVGNSVGKGRKTNAERERIKNLLNKLDK